MRYGTLLLGLMSFVGMVSSITVLKTSDHSTQKSLTLFVEKIEAGRHSSIYRIYHISSTYQMHQKLTVGYGDIVNSQTGQNSTFFHPIQTPT